MVTIPEKEKAAGGDHAAVKNAYKNNFTNRSGGKQGYSFAEINAMALPVLPALLSRWLPGGVLHGQEYTVRNPTRADNKPGSFSINTCTGRWADFSTGDRGGDIISLAAYLFGLSQGEALRRVAGMMGAPRHD